MTETLPGREPGAPFYADSPDVPSDAELISRVRGGDLSSYGELFERHVEAARRLARQLVRGPDSEDLVSDAFAKVMGVLQRGGGPDVAFRAYLLTAVRRLHVDKMRAQSRLTTTDDLTPFDPGVPFRDTAVAGFESGAAAKAFASLPERWQLVLWHLEVEGQKPADIAPLLGMSANSVSALAYRAREGLRQAFLNAHLADTADTTCRWTTEHLGGYVRDGLSKRDAGKVRAHLDECVSCTAMYLEVTEVNSNLKAIIGPLLLGGAATGYLAAASGGGGAAVGGILLLLDRAKDVVVANLVTVGAGAAAAAVATVAVVSVAVSGDGDRGDRGAETPSAVAPAPSPGDGQREDRPRDQRPGARNAASDLMLTSAFVLDDTVSLTVDGLPDKPVVITVDLESTSGLTTFAPQSGACAVTENDPTQARCTTASGSGGASLLSLAPSTFETTLPLAFPADLSDDQLTLAVSIEGERDADADDNRVSFDFTPGSSIPVEPTDPPTLDPEVDLRLGLEPAGETAVRATVDGLPDSLTSLEFQVQGAAFGPAPAGCTTLNGLLTCEVPGPTFSVDLPLEFDPVDAPVSVTISVSATGLTESTPADNSATVSVGTPLPTVDLVVSTRPTFALLRPGRVFVSVAGVPGVPFRLQVTPANDAVTLEGVPGQGTRPINGDTCTTVPDLPGVLECVTADGTFEGHLNLDIRSLGARDHVDVTVGAAVPGHRELNAEDNLARFRVSRWEIVSLEVKIGQLKGLIRIGLILGSMANPLQ